MKINFFIKFSDSRLVRKEKNMAAAIIFLSTCIVLLVMYSIICALWDVILGRWSREEQKKNFQQDLNDLNERTG